MQTIEKPLSEVRNQWQLHVTRHKLHSTNHVYWIQTRRNNNGVVMSAIIGGCCSRSRHATMWSGKYCSENANPPLYRSESMVRTPSVHLISCIDKSVRPTPCSCMLNVTHIRVRMSPKNNDWLVISTHSAPNQTIPKFFPLTVSNERENHFN